MYITTEYEAEAIAGRRRAIMTIRNHHGVLWEMPVAILSYDRGRANQNAASIVFEGDGAPMMHYGYTGDAKEA